VASNETCSVCYLEKGRYVVVLVCCFVCLSDLCLSGFQRTFWLMEFSWTRSSWSDLCVAVAKSLKEILSLTRSESQNTCSWYPPTGYLTTHCHSSHWIRDCLYFNSRYKGDNIQHPRQKLTRKRVVALLCIISLSDSGPASDAIRQRERRLPTSVRSINQYLFIMAWQNAGQQTKG